MCDRPLKAGEIIWYEEEQRHEEYCSKCRGVIAVDMQSDSDDINVIPIDRLTTDDIIIGDDNV
jgi:hypothetical protein